VAVKPGRDKPFTVFLQDDAQCRQHARERLARGADSRAASDAHVPEAQLNVRQRYDLAYLACMQAKGNEVSQLAGANHAARTSDLRRKDCYLYLSDGGDADSAAFARPR
jgi:hypothetical protein